MITNDLVNKLRADTPGTKHRIHLNNAGAALMPTPVIESMQAYLQLESEIGGYEAADLKQKEIDEFYIEAAGLFGGLPRNYAFAANATDAYSKALSAIPFKSGDIIVTTENDYISNQIAFLSLRKRFGIDIARFENLDDDTIDLEKAALLVQQLKPKLVAISHVATNTGAIQPVKDLGQICADAKVLYLVDACQSMGQLQVDATEIACDFMSGTFRKFLRGPRGAGLLYIADKVLDGGYEPLFIDMRGAKWIDKDTYEQEPTAKRFEDWEFPYALVMGSIEALKYANNLGMANIESRVKYLSDYLRAELKGIVGVTTVDKGQNLAGIIPIVFADLDAERIGNALDAQAINWSMSLREYAVIEFAKKKVAWALRISPHYYNTEQELDQFLEVVTKHC